MYDGTIYCKEYQTLKELIEDTINGDIEDIDLNDIKDHIQQLYDDDEMSAEQYDELTGYIDDFLV